MRRDTAPRRLAKCCQAKTACDTIIFSLTRHRLIAGTAARPDNVPVNERRSSTAIITTMASSCGGGGLLLQLFFGPRVLCCSVARFRLQKADQQPSSVVAVAAVAAAEKGLCRCLLSK